MEANILSKLLVVVRYTYPSLIFLCFIVASIIALGLAPSDVQYPQQKDIIARLFALVILCFGLDGAVNVAGIIFSSLWPSQEDTIGLSSCILAFGIIAQSFEGTSDIVMWYQLHGFLQFIGMQRTHAVNPRTASRSEILLFSHASLACARCVIFAAISLVYLWQDRRKHGGSDDEETPLLPSPGPSPGSNRMDAADTSVTCPQAQSKRNWFIQFQKLMVLYPYIWPKKDRSLQIRLGLVGLCILANNGINLLIPRQYGILVDCLSTSSERNPWPQVAIFMTLRLLSSEAGIQFVRKVLWLPVEQYWEKALSTAAFSHIMYLSADFHDSADLIELQMAIMSGNSISYVAEMICFQAAPTMIDLVIAVAYLSVKFGPYEGLIILATTVAFVKFSLRIISSAREQQRQVLERRSDESKSRYYSISRWFTVVMFNHIEREKSGYSNALESRLIASKEVHKGMAISSAAKYLILLGGQLASILVILYQIRTGEATAGDLVLLLSYWGQIAAPLGFFATLGQGVGQQLTELERLVDILHKKPSVADNVGARPLQFQSGNVEFWNVSFSYNGKRNVLDNFHLSVPSGHTIAFVGTSGAGKSTILTLLMRQHDVQKGYISIDGQDIRQITQESLRETIGIVPQSPQLFEDTILANVRYARPTASDEDVHNACKAAAIHDQIMGFPGKYLTRVGGNNGQLSGGQIQRVAIARAILRNPRIVLLDEATSSVDTDTEQQIQKALDSLCQDRTTFIVAHRLSTVRKADTICVVSEGKIIEKGNHNDLISQGGKYASLWSKQTCME
ncbi:P-loop containing nucleoside triphosphate hydrolase protein [Xylariaceae sp. AK1471]|nr:P-loop containing nucleoside triphosphate hydrolase protein [Xylariaceae sp. AK1471]